MMLKALNTAATGMQAQQTQLDVIANNMANVSTTGFKKSRAEFEDLLYQTIKEPGAQQTNNTVHPTGVQTGMGVRTAATEKIFEQGHYVPTHKPLDLAIEGSGFFPIQMMNGQVGYTRDGTFQKDAGGKIVDKNGNALLPEIVASLWHWEKNFEAGSLYSDTQTAGFSDRGKRVFSDPNDQRPSRLHARRDISGCGRQDRR